MADQNSAIRRKARRTALFALARAHKPEFQGLYQAALKDLGYTPRVAKPKAKKATPKKKVAKKAAPKKPARSKSGPVRTRKATPQELGIKS